MKIHYITKLNSVTGGDEIVLYQKKDLNPQGLLGLLLPDDAIPQKTVYLK